MIYLTRHFDGDSPAEGSFLEVPTEVIELTLNNETDPKRTRLSNDMQHFYLCDSDQDKLLSKLERLSLCYRIIDKEHAGASFIRSLSPAAWV